MPTKQLPENPNIDHLKYQAKDLLKAVSTRDPQVAQRVREFHPRFKKSTDAEIFETTLSLSDAQLAIAREYGFPSWAKLRSHIEKPTLADNLNLPKHERIEDPAFRRAVDLLDAGDADGLSAYLKQHPGLVHQRVNLEGGNYFRNPSLLEFSAENPVRRGSLSANIVQVMKIILDAGAKEDPAGLNETLGLVCSGRVPRECGVQIPMIEVLCQYGADPNFGMAPALPHGEFDAVDGLIRCGARVDLPVAAATGRIEDARRSLATASAEERHRALALASQFGHAEVVRLLLTAGEDPSRYNPMGNHSHSTPLHQAALTGNLDVVRLLVEQGARVDLKDTLFQGTPAGWAKYAGKTEVEEYLRARENPFMGTWLADVAESKPHPENPYRSATLEFAVDGDDFTISDVVVDVSGREMRGKNSFRADGKEHPYEDRPGYSLLANRLGSHTLEVLAKKDGREEGRVRYEVFPDGKTLGVTAKDAGTGFNQVALFHRA